MSQNAEWKEIKSFVNDACPDVIVVVSKLDLREPKYSLRLGMRMPGEAPKDGATGKLRAHVQYGNSHTPDGLTPGSVSTLVAEAEAYIYTEQMEAIARTEAEEEARAEANRKRKSQYLQNVEARRNSNREATAKAKAGNRK
jgi:hypothetical protein